MSDATSSPPRPELATQPVRSFLARSAWVRMASTVPVLGLLWLLVVWASLQAPPL